MKKNRDNKHKVGSLLVVSYQSHPKSYHFLVLETSLLYQKDVNENHEVAICRRDGCELCLADCDVLITTKFLVNQQKSYISSRSYRDITNNFELISATNPE